MIMEVYLFIATISLLIVMIAILEYSKYRLDKSLEESKKITEEYNRLVQDVVDWEAGVKFSSEYIQEVADEMSKKPEYFFLTPFLKSLAENLLNEAKIK